MKVALNSTCVVDRSWVGAGSAADSQTDIGVAQKGRTLQDLKKDFDRIVTDMPNRHAFSGFNNFFAALGFTTMVCGEQATYTAAVLEMMGWDARVVNGTSNGFTHSWVEVLVPGQGWIEADPWDGATIPSENRCKYQFDGRWDISRDQAHTIFTDFIRRSGG